jgi:hypothetical protein
MLRVHGHSQTGGGPCTSPRSPINDNPGPVDLSKVVPRPTRRAVMASTIEEVVHEGKHNRGVHGRGKGLLARALCKAQGETAGYGLRIAFGF